MLLPTWKHSPCRQKPKDLMIGWRKEIFKSLNSKLRDAEAIVLAHEVCEA